MSRVSACVTAVVLVHLAFNVAHGLAHGRLQVGLTLAGSLFVAVVVLSLPLIAMALVWTRRKSFGLLLLSASMFGSLLFGLYHHFLVTSPDHVHAQPATAWGIAFVVTAWGLLITEALGAYVGIHFLWLATSKKAPSPVEPT